MTHDTVYVLPDKLGGVFNFCANLLRHRRTGGTRYGAVLTHNRWSTDIRAGERLPADWQTTVEEQLPAENLYAALRRVRRAVNGRGALVSHDWLGLATASAFPLERTVFAVVHGDMDYYYDLAVRHEPDVDAFVTYTEAIRRRLHELMPHRADTIFLRRYGVEIGGRRIPVAGPLRLLYAGRVDRRKGVFDLPPIDARLRASGVEVTWTVQGTGPDLEELRAKWDRTDVRWTGRQTMPQVLAEYERHDVLVMPSRSEGLPVALLEAGAAAVVPVISDLASGIPEIVRQGETGWRAPVGDIGAFAAAIETLARDRGALERMSGCIRDVVAREWDITLNAPAYEALFDRWDELRRHRVPGRRTPYGSLLDRRWLPNAMVKAIRAFTLRASAHVG